MLVAVLHNEVRMGAVPRNVAGLSVLPQIEKRGARRRSDRRALSRDELRQMLSAATGAVGVFIDLTGRNGLRPAEARARLWSYVDLGSGLLRVELQMDGDDEPTDVKTLDSERTIRLDARTLDRLTAWAVRQDRYHNRAGPRWSDRDYVVTTRYGTPINRNNMVRSIRALCTNLGIEPIVPYELRHTAISHQADAGRSSWEIADWCGSSERMISEVYRHRLAEVSKLTPADEDGNDTGPRG